jgi:LysR family hydrogen peroxide-inducible transcriptional activator
MTLTELRYIVAVARERHFGRAAEACHVSQPTLSVAIKKLEEELGAQIFERTSAEVAMTALGILIVGQSTVKILYRAPCAWVQFIPSHLTCCQALCG